MSKSARKNIDTSAVDQFLTKPEITISKTVVTAENIERNDKKSIIISDMFNNIRDDRVERKSHSFYLTNKTHNALAERAKAKGISNSKFLEGILKQLFEQEE